MSEKQMELLKKLLDMPQGTTLKKGNRKRILLGISPGFVLYKVPSRPNQKTMEATYKFMQWAESAEII